MTPEELLKYQNDPANKTSGVTSNDTGVGPSASAVTGLMGGSPTYQPMAAGENDPMAYHPLQPGEYNPNYYHPLGGTPEGINPATMPTIAAKNASNQRDVNTAASMPSGGVGPSTPLGSGTIPTNTPVTLGSGSNIPSPGIGPTTPLPFGNGNPINTPSPMSSSPVAAPMNNMNGISPSINATNSMLNNSANPNKKLLGQFGGY